MDEPELYGDETILITTPDVFVKSVAFEAYLTNKRIILIDRRKNIIPQKDILLATIHDAQSGENAIHDPVLSVTLITSSGEKKQVVLSFPQKTGGVRNRERDEWAKTVRELTTSSVQRVVRTVIPGHKEFRNATGEHQAPVKIKIVGRPSAEEPTVVPAPAEGVSLTGQSEQEPVATEQLPHGSFCSRCGNRVGPEALFCNRCGARLSTTAQEPVRIEPEGPAPHGTAGVPAAPHGGSDEQPVLKTAVNEAAGGQEPVPGVPKRPVSAGDSGSGSRRRLFTILAVIVIIIVVAAAGLFVYQNFLKGSPKGPAEPSGSTGTPAVTATTTARPAATPSVTYILPEATPVPITTDGVYVWVNYIGAWKGTYGVTNAMVPAAQSGEGILRVENATGVVQASFKKDDASTRPHELVVEIYRNGALIKRGVTTQPKGQVDISVNIATATPITVATTAAGTPSATTAPVTTGTTAP